MFVLLVTTC